MKTVSILDDYFAYNDWANQRVIEMSQPLSDDQLDEVRPMGFGTLRNTLFHILEAESLWLDRWLAKPWRPLVPDAGGMPVAEMGARLARVAAERNPLLADANDPALSRRIRYRNTQGRDFSFELGDLMNHVINHGIHHRSQAMNYLKRFGVTVPGGIDYLFWKLAFPSCPQAPESLEPLRQRGVVVEESEGPIPRWDHKRIACYFAYGDWAMQRVFATAAGLEDNELDRDFLMGPGTFRKVLQHTIDAERWWLRNWSTDGSAFPRDELPRSLREMQAQWNELTPARSQFIESLDENGSQRVVAVSGGGPQLRFRVVESLMQLCCHGTLHRAQLINMLRQLERPCPPMDLVVWLDEMETH
jgi:uncharacterized damage-inducible protein DinB